MLRKVLSCALALLIGLSPEYVYAQSLGEALNLPAAGSMVQPSAAFNPLVLRGLTVDPENPLRFDFIVDAGDEKGDEVALKEMSQRLVNYFLASMTMPEGDLWVNLSPVEKDRVIPDALNKTELGRDLLAQDYLLKQLTATMFNPDQALGKAFWAKVYAQAQEKFGTTDIPTDTFNKVWILPESAKVFEKGRTVYIVDGHLKVMLEADYAAANQRAERVGGGVPDPLNPALAAQKSTVNGQPSAVDGPRLTVDPVTDPASNPSQELVRSITREIILPAIEKEVNEGRNFSKLRQMFYSLILAQWYQEAFKQSVINKVYAGQSKVAGIDLNDPKNKEVIFQQYVSAYKTGVFSFIREEVDRVSKEALPRKYFSGGMKWGKRVNIDHTPAMKQVPVSGLSFRVLAELQIPDGRFVPVERHEENLERDIAGLVSHLVYPQEGEREPAEALLRAFKRSRTFEGLSERLRRKIEAFLGESRAAGFYETHRDFIIGSIDAFLSFAMTQDQGRADVPADVSRDYPATLIEWLREGNYDDIREQDMLRLNILPLLSLQQMMSLGLPEKILLRPFVSAGLLNRQMGANPLRQGYSLKDLQSVASADVIVSAVERGFVSAQVGVFVRQMFFYGLLSGDFIKLDEGTLGRIIDLAFSSWDSSRWARNFLFEVSKNAGKEFLRKGRRLSAPMVQGVREGIAAKTRQARDARQILIDLPEILQPYLAPGESAGSVARQLVYARQMGVKLALLPSTQKRTFFQLAALIDKVRKQPGRPMRLQVNSVSVRGGEVSSSLLDRLWNSPFTVETSVGRNEETINIVIPEKMAILPWDPIVKKAGPAAGAEEAMEQDALVRPVQALYSYGTETLWSHPGGRFSIRTTIPMAGDGYIGIILNDGTVEGERYGAQQGRGDLDSPAVPQDYSRAVFDAVRRMVAEQGLSQQPLDQVDPRQLRDLVWDTVRRAVAEQSAERAMSDRWKDAQGRWKIGQKAGQEIRDIVPADSLHELVWVYYSDGTRALWTAGNVEIAEMEDRTSESAWISDEGKFVYVSYDNGTYGFWSLDGRFIGPSMLMNRPSYTSTALLRAEEEVSLSTKTVKIAGKSYPAASVIKALRLLQRRMQRKQIEEGVDGGLVLVYRGQEVSDPEIADIFGEIGNLLAAPFYLGLTSTEKDGLSAIHYRKIVPFGNSRKRLGRLAGKIAGWAAKSEASLVKSGGTLSERAMRNLAEDPLGVRIIEARREGLLRAAREWMAQNQGKIMSPGGKPLSISFRKGRMTSAVYGGTDTLDVVLTDKDLSSAGRFVDVLSSVLARGKWDREGFRTLLKRAEVDFDVLVRGMDLFTRDMGVAITQNHQYATLELPISAWIYAVNRIAASLADGPILHLGWIELANEGDGEGARFRAAAVEALARLMAQELGGVLVVKNEENTVSMRLSRGAALRGLMGRDYLDAIKAEIFFSLRGIAENQISVFGQRVQGRYLIPEGEMPYDEFMTHVMSGLIGHHQPVVVRLKGQVHYPQFPDGNIPSETVRFDELGHIYYGFGDRDAIGTRISAEDVYSVVVNSLESAMTANTVALGSGQIVKAGEADAFVRTLRRNMSVAAVTAEGVTGRGILFPDQTALQHEVLTVDLQRVTGARVVAAGDGKRYLFWAEKDPIQISIDVNAWILDIQRKVEAVRFVAQVAADEGVWNIENIDGEDLAVGGGKIRLAMVETAYPEKYGAYVGVTRAYGQEILIRFEKGVVVIGKDGKFRGQLSLEGYGMPEGVPDFVGGGWVLHFKGQPDVFVGVDGQSEKIALGRMRLSYNRYFGPDGSDSGWVVGFESGLLFVDQKGGVQQVNPGLGRYIKTEKMKGAGTLSAFEEGLVFVGPKGKATPVTSQYGRFKKMQMFDGAGWLAAFDKGLVFVRHDGTVGFEQALESPDFEEEGWNLEGSGWQHTGEKHPFTGTGWLVNVGPGIVLVGKDGICRYEGMETLGAFRRGMVMLKGVGGVGLFEKGFVFISADGKVVKREGLEQYGEPQGIDVREGAGWLMRFFGGVAVVTLAGDVYKAESINEIIKVYPAAAKLKKIETSISVAPEPAERAMSVDFPVKARQFIYLKTPKRLRFSVGDRSEQVDIWQADEGINIRTSDGRVVTKVQGQDIFFPVVGNPGEEIFVYLSLGQDHLRNIFVYNMGEADVALKISGASVEAAMGTAAADSLVDEIFEAGKGRLHVLPNYVLNGEKLFSYLSPMDVSLGKTPQIGAEEIGLTTVFRREMNPLKILVTDRAGLRQFLATLPVFAAEDIRRAVDPSWYQRELAMSRKMPGVRFIPRPQGDAVLERQVKVTDEVTGRVVLTRMVRIRNYGVMKWAGQRVTPEAVISGDGWDVRTPGGKTLVSCSDDATGDRVMFYPGDGYRVSVSEAAMEAERPGRVNRILFRVGVSADRELAPDFPAWKMRVSAVTPQGEAQIQVTDYSSGSARMRVNEAYRPGLIVQDWDTGKPLFRVLSVDQKKQIVSLVRMNTAQAWREVLEASGDMTIPLDETLALLRLSDLPLDVKYPLIHEVEAKIQDVEDAWFEADGGEPAMSKEMMIERFNLLVSRRRISVEDRSYAVHFRYRPERVSPDAFLANLAKKGKKFLLTIDMPGDPSWDQVWDAVNRALPQTDSGAVVDALQKRVAFEAAMARLSDGEMNALFDKIKGHNNALSNSIRLPGVKEALARYGMEFMSVRPDQDVPLKKDEVGVFYYPGPRRPGYTWIMGRERFREFLKAVSDQAEAALLREIDRVLATRKVTSRHVPFRRIPTYEETRLWSQRMSWWGGLDRVDGNELRIFKDREFMGLVAKADLSRLMPQEYKAPGLPETVRTGEVLLVEDIRMGGASDLFGYPVWIVTRANGGQMHRVVPFLDDKRQRRVRLMQQREAPEGERISIAAEEFFKARRDEMSLAQEKVVSQWLASDEKGSAATSGSQELAMSGEDIVLSSGSRIGVEEADSFVRSLRRDMSIYGVMVQGLRGRGIVFPQDKQWAPPLVSDLLKASGAEIKMSDDQGYVLFWQDREPIDIAVDVNGWVLDMQRKVEAVRFVQMHAPREKAMQQAIDPLMESDQASELVSRELQKIADAGVWSGHLPIDIRRFVAAIPEKKADDFMSRVLEDALRLYADYAAAERKIQAYIVYEFIREISPGVSAIKTTEESIVLSYFVSDRGYQDLSWSDAETRKKIVRMTVEAVRLRQRLPAEISRGGRISLGTAPLSIDLSIPRVISVLEREFIIQPTESGISVMEEGKEPLLLKGYGERDLVGSSSSPNQHVRMTYGPGAFAISAPDADYKTVFLFMREAAMTAEQKKKRTLKNLEAEKEELFNTSPVLSYVEGGIVVHKAFPSVETLDWRVRNFEAQLDLPQQDRVFPSWMDGRVFDSIFDQWKGTLRDGGNMIHAVWGEDLSSLFDKDHPETNRVTENGRLIDIDGKETVLSKEQVALGVSRDGKDYAVVFDRDGFKAFMRRFSARDFRGDEVMTALDRLVLGVLEGVFNGMTWGRPDAQIRVDFSRMKLYSSFVLYRPREKETLFISLDPVMVLADLEGFIAELNRTLGSHTEWPRAREQLRTVLSQVRVNPKDFKMMALLMKDVVSRIDMEEPDKLGAFDPGPAAAEISWKGSGGKNMVLSVGDWRNDPDRAAFISLKAEGKTVAGIRVGFSPVESRLALERLVNLSSPVYLELKELLDQFPGDQMTADNSRISEILATAVGGSLVDSIFVRRKMAESGQNGRLDFGSQEMGHLGYYLLRPTEGDPVWLGKLTAARNWEDLAEADRDEFARVLADVATALGKRISGSIGSFYAFIRKELLSNIKWWAAETVFKTGKGMIHDVSFTMPAGVGTRKVSDEKSPQEKEIWLRERSTDTTYIFDAKDFGAFVSALSPDALQSLWKDVNASAKGRGTLMRAERAEPAMESVLRGGIDFNTVNMIREGEVMAAPFAGDGLEQMLRNAPGLKALLIEFTPIKDLRMFLGLSREGVVPADSEGMSPAAAVRRRGDEFAGV